VVPFAVQSTHDTPLRPHADWSRPKSQLPFESQQPPQIAAHPPPPCASVASSFGVAPSSAAPSSPGAALSSSPRAPPPLEEFAPLLLELLAPPEDDEVLVVEPPSFRGAVGEFVSSLVSVFPPVAHAAASETTRTVRAPAVRLDARAFDPVARCSVTPIVAPLRPSPPISNQLTGAQ
jgi:hypothetical protein